MSETEPGQMARMFLRDPRTNCTMILKRAPDRFAPGRTELPGGNFDASKDEDLIDCGMRETGEETGVWVPRSSVRKLGQEGPRLTSQGVWKVTEFLMAEADCRQAKPSASHSELFMVNRPDLPFLGPDYNYREDGINLNSLNFSWLKRYAQVAREIITHEAEVLPFMYYAVYHWIPDELLGPPKVIDLRPSLIASKI